MSDKRSVWRNWQIDPLTGDGRALDRHDRLIPMINVVFLLLTFFLIAGTLRVSDGLKIELPEIAAERVVKRRSPVLSVEASGALYFNGRQMEVSRAIVTIKEALGKAPGEALHVKADRNTPASIILPLLQKLRDSGIEAIRLIAVKKGK